MTYGLHSEAVQETLDFAKTGDLLQASKRPESSPLVVRDLGVARRMAWEDRYGDEELLWTDIREREMSLVKGATYSRPEFGAIKEKLSSELKVLVTCIKRRLDKAHADFLDDMVADLWNCALNRAVNGVSENFFEHI